MKADSPAMAGLRAHGLRVLFALSLAFEGVPLLGLWMEADFPANPFPEGQWLHDLFETGLPFAAALALAAGMDAALRRFAPGFLRVPETAPLPFVLWRLLFHAPIVYLGLLIAFIALGLALEPPPWDSSNPQHIPIVFFLAPIMPLAFLLPVTAVTVWLAARRRAE